MSNLKKAPKASRANMVVLIACGAIAVGMVGMSYAAVPLYKIFCQVTGYGGTTQRAELTDDIPIIDRKVTVRFDANINKDLNWHFKPVQREVTINMGKPIEIKYTAENLTDETLTGQASFNVTPQAAGVYFNKIQCFCFTETTLKPHEKIDMPVLFYVDPDMDKDKELDNISTITLSYTFYREDNPDSPVAALKESKNKTTLN